MKACNRRKEKNRTAEVRRRRSKANRRSSFYRLNVGGRLGGSLKKNESILLSEQLTLLGTHRSPVLQIALVSNQHDCHVRVAVLTRFFEPPAQVVETFPSRDVINQQSTCRIAIVGSSNRSKGFLAGLNIEKLISIMYKEGNRKFKL